jgi:hypothetical protein
MMMMMMAPAGVESVLFRGERGQGPSPEHLLQNLRY